ncbi:hypothetical protein KAJ61_02345 [Candidatus Parcubacteria bacterium]|nr:hypothetical protein [Candidatus Parcubacteria bacterium]
MKILITGVGKTGKSTFRKKLVKNLLNSGQSTESYDCDYDRNYLPKSFSNDIIYIIEDVHGPTKNAVFPLEFFDMIFYIMPKWFTSLRFWVTQAIPWYKLGKFAWDADAGKYGEWKGTGKNNDIRNFFPIICEIFIELKNRNKWIKEDIAIIKKTTIKYVVVVPRKKGGKIIF